MVCGQKAKTDSNASHAIALGLDVITNQSASMIIGQHGTALSSATGATGIPNNDQVTVMGTGSFQIANGTGENNHHICVVIGSTSPGGPGAGRRFNH